MIPSGCSCVDLRTCIAGSGLYSFITYGIASLPNFQKAKIEYVLLQNPLLRFRVILEEPSGGGTLAIETWHLSLIRVVCLNVDLVGDS